MRQTFAVVKQVLVEGRWEVVDLIVGFDHLLDCRQWVAAQEKNQNQTVKYQVRTAQHIGQKRDRR